MQKQDTSMNSKNDVEDDDKAELAEYKKLYVRQFVSAKCDFFNGELFTLSFTKEFRETDTVFRLDVLGDIIAALERQYEGVFEEMRRTEWRTEDDGNQGCSDQLRGGEDIAQAGQDGDHPDAVDTPE